MEIYSFYLFLFSKSQPAYLFELLQPLGITVELPWFRVQGIRTLLLPNKNEKKGMLTCEGANAEHSKSCDDGHGLYDGDGCDGKYWQTLALLLFLTSYVQCQ